MTTAAWRVALRLAFRDLSRKARWRSLLVVALIALPVAALVAGDVVDRTFHIPPALAYQRTNGTATSAELTSAGAPVAQSPDGASFGSPPERLTPQDRDPSAPATVVRVLGPGTHLLQRRILVSVETTGADGTVTVAHLDGVDLRSPVAAGLAPLLRGRVPSTTGEVVVTPALAGADHIGIGATLHVVGPRLTLRVVGLVRAQSDERAETAFVALADLPAGASASTDWLATSPRPVTWGEVRRLDTDGWVTDSRWIVEHPPAPSLVAYPATNGPSTLQTYATPAALIGGLALLELVLLAGPAFAVLARRQERNLALVAAAGGRPSDLRNTVLSAGVLLGGAASLLGFGAGVVAAALVVPVIAHHAHRPGPFAVPDLEVAAVATVGLVTALAAALWPARAAARNDVATTLAGRRPRRPPRARVSVAAAMLVVVGLLVAVSGRTHPGGAVATDVILVGVALIELGFVLATPAVLVATARLGRWLPLGARLAVRDAGRNRSAAAPAAAAVMAAVLACVAMLLGSSSYESHGRASYQPSTPMGDVTVPLAQFGPGAGPSVAARLRAVLPASAVVVLSAPGCNPADPCREAGFSQVQVAVPSGEVRTTRYRDGSGGQAVVTGPLGLEALFDIRPGPATVALAAGDAVVADAWAVRDGRTTVSVQTSLPSGRSVTRMLSIPAVAETAGFAGAEIVLPASLAATMDTGSYPNLVLAEDRAMPTSAQLARLQSGLLAVSAAHPQAGQPAVSAIDVEVERGWHDRLRVPILWLLATVALVAVAGAVVATNLSNLDRREDLLTIESVGARSGTRRNLAASRAGLVAGLGTVLGTAAGLVPVVAWILEQNHRTGASASATTGRGTPGVLTVANTDPLYHLVVPWPTLLAVVVGIPAVAALVAVAFAGAKLAVDRPNWAATA